MFLVYYNPTFPIIIYEKEKYIIIIIKCTFILHLHTLNFSQVYPHGGSGNLWKTAESLDFTGFVALVRNCGKLSYA